MAWDTRVQSQVESYQRLKKWYLIPPYLTLSILRYGSRVKWDNPGKGVAPSTIPWCGNCPKGSLLVTLDYGRQLIFFILFFSSYNVWKHVQYPSHTYLIALMIYSCNEWYYDIMIYSCNERMKVDKTLSSLLLERYEIGGNCERETETKDPDTEDCYIDPFLTYIVSPYSGPYILTSLTGGSQLGSAGADFLPLWHSPAALQTSSLSKSLLPDWLTITNHSICRYSYIYNFIMSMLSSGSWFTWSASGCQPTWAVLLFT